MKAWLVWVVDRPIVAAALVVMATAALALQLPRLRTDESVEGMMVDGDPARAFYEQSKARFGSDTLTVVVVKAADVFHPDVLGLIRRLTDTLEGFDGVSRVESLTTVKNIKGEGDFLDTEPLVAASIPTDAGALAKIRRDALGHRVLVGNLVAADARTTAINVYTEAHPSNGGFQGRFVAAVDTLLARESRGGVTLYQIGGPFTKVAYTRALERDLRTVVPIGTAVLFVTLFLTFRSAQGVVIPMVTAGLSIVWAMGLMALADIPLTILTGLIPSLLVAIGFTEDVHMITEYHHRLDEGDDRLTALRRMLRDGALPITVTTATTVVGFGSLALTNITMLRQFGHASAMALTANFVVTMLVLPVVLRWWPGADRRRVPAGAGTLVPIGPSPTSGTLAVDGARGADEGALTDGAAVAAAGSSAAHGAAARGRIARLMRWLGRFNLRFRVPILVATALISLVSLVGWYRLRVDTDIIGFFHEGSPVRQRIADLHDSLAGGLTFHLVVDTGRPDGAKDPIVLRQVAALQEFLAGTGLVDKTVSLADYVRKMHREMNGGDPAFEVIPDSVPLIHQYLLLLEGPDLAKLLDFDGAALNVVVRHNLTGSGALSGLLRRIDRYVAEQLPRNLVVQPTGEAILFNNASDYMAVNELTSFSFTFVVIGVIHSIMFMSLRAGALSLLPNVVPIVAVYGLMGLLGVPLNTATATIASIALGIAVDDTVHHMATYHRQLRIHHNQRVAMLETMRIEGAPIIYVSLALSAGFLTMTASSFAPTVTWGLFAALAMLLALAAELLLTPVLMFSVRLVTLWDVVMLKMNPDLVRSAPLLRGLSAFEARKIVLLGELQSVAPGELVIRKGEPGRAMYMLVTGCARVFDRTLDGNETELVTLEPGAVFGEMALVTGEARSVYVAAETPVEVLRLDGPALERLRRTFPYTAAKMFRNLTHLLSDRLRQRTEGLVAERLARQALEARLRSTTP